jgi:hypothetical protein
MFAHNVGGGALPAPPWLLGYLGAAVVLGTAVALRAMSLSPRPATADTDAPRAAPRVGFGAGVGLVLLVAVFVAAIAGPDSAAANIAPRAVFVVWWVGLPIACLLLGDVMRAISPFVGVIGASHRVRSPVDPEPDGPTWTAAAFLAAFSWFFLAYHRPGSPRALATFLGAYALVAVAAGLRWGRAWLATGEGFGGLSAAVARIGLRRPAGPMPAGTASLMIVWVGGTAFDAFTNTPFWVDILGTSRGWSRTLLNSVGLIWLTAIVAGAYLLVVRVAERGRAEGDEPRHLTVPLAAGLVPLATAWFLAHDLTLLTFEGQNFYALLSDPLGKGWDLFGTLNHTIDYRVVQSSWVRWTQVGILAVGHVTAVVLLHDAALGRLRRRPAMLTTWVMAGVTGASITAAALLVLA